MGIPAFAAAFFRQLLTCAARFAVTTKPRWSKPGSLRKADSSAAGAAVPLATNASKLLNLGAREVPSNRIGELVMRELKKMDKVAYIRFASVYRSFEDIDEFKTLVDQVRR